MVMIIVSNILWWVDRMLFVGLVIRVIVILGLGLRCRIVIDIDIILLVNFDIFIILNCGPR
jgi:hypothetical protein